MRKILFLLFTTLVLVSCDVTYSTPEELNTKQVYNFHVKAGDWQSIADANGLNRYYKYSFKISGITQAMVNNGAAFAYMDNSDYQVALPSVRHYENLSGEKWTRTIDFDYSATDVTFYVTNSDFAIDPPGEMYFKVVFIW